MYMTSYATISVNRTHKLNSLIRCVPACRPMVVSLAVVPVADRRRKGFGRIGMQEGGAQSVCLWSSQLFGLQVGLLAMQVVESGSARVSSSCR